MEVKQIYELVNDATKEVLGETAVVEEDLSNLVDIGSAIFDNNAKDPYVKTILNRIGKTVFVARKYNGTIPSMFMDGWEYGSIMAKISGELPEATENESWELQNGASYDPNIFYQTHADEKFYNKRVTFEIPMSITDIQIKQSFLNAQEMNSFLTMLQINVENAMTIKIDSLIARTLNNMVGETFHAEVPGAVYSGRSGNKCVNLLYLYNQRFGTSLTAEKSVTEPAFLKFAAYILGLYADRLSKMSTLFNVGGKERFTSKDRLDVIYLSDFQKAVAPYAHADTFNKEDIQFPDGDVVPYWQGSGTNYSFANTSKISIKTASNNTIEATGILAVMKDHESCGVCNKDKRVTSNYNAKAEFYNNWHKFDCEYFNDTNENFIVFYVA